MSNKNWVEDVSDRATYWIVGTTWVFGLTMIGLINLGVIT